MTKKPSRKNPYDKWLFAKGSPYGQKVLDNKKKTYVRKPKHVKKEFDE